MAVLVLGATGATGKLLIIELLDRGCKVKALVRDTSRLPAQVESHPLLSVIYGNISEMTDGEIQELVQGCDSIASCLGHNMTLKGIFGAPRDLVTRATRRVCEAANRDQRAQPIKYVLMNTAGNSNRDIDEQVSFAQRFIVGLIRVLVPPHKDNERAADYLRTHFTSTKSNIGWSVVRPDSLIDEMSASKYEVHPSPIRSAIFDPGTTSRYNVAHFMADLITDEIVWQKWSGKMPVIYNEA